MYCKERSFREPTIPHRKRTPSFSSSLLDAIYRSIDESDAANTVINGSLTKKESNFRTDGESLEFPEEKIGDRRRAMIIENWVEKKSSYRWTTNSTSSSSDSSSGGIFSSSEAESYSRSSRSSKSEKIEKINQEKIPKRSGFDGKLTKTKLKAMKIYEELKKAKQPISPGGRLTTFLNSIFNSNAKKVKICSVGGGAMEDVSSEQRKSKSSSLCSPASSFSKSCFSRTPSTTTRVSSNSSSNNKNKNAKRGAEICTSNGKMKRSVRFYPASVILDDKNDPSLMPSLKIAENIAKKRSSPKKEPKIDRIREVNCTASNRRRKEKLGIDSKRFGYSYNNGDDEEDDEDDDAWSYSSSDLFELDHRIGIARYREELPVYETTDLKTNRAIAKGLIL